MHWPDERTPFEETARALLDLQKEGKIHAIGLSNFSLDQIRQFQRVVGIDALQLPYNLFERGVEKELLPFCKKEKMAFLAYGPLCRGLLTGKMHPNTTFPQNDLRNVDPKFSKENFSRYLDCVEKLKDLSQERYKKPLAALAARYLLDKGADVVLWGCRTPEQIDPILEVDGWRLSEKELLEIEEILKSLSQEIGAEFMAPPLNEKAPLA